MEEAILEADRDGAPEDEIQDLMVRGFEITRRIMAARKDHIRTLEEEMKQMYEYKRRFARRLSGDDRANNAG